MNSLSSPVQVIDRYGEPLSPESSPVQWGRGILAVVAGGCAGAVLWGVLDSGMVGEPIAVLVLAAMLVLVPSSSWLSPRLAVNIAILVGWAPLLWWIRWPIEVNHGAALAGIVMAALIAYVLLASSPRARFRSLLPAVRPTDALLPLGTVVAFVGVAPLAMSATPAGALTVLLPGADNWAHFAMFNNLRSYGATTDVLGPAPDGSGWAFSQYPKGFHTLVATLSEVTFPVLSDRDASLVAYAHSVALVVVLGVVLITAALLSLPGLGARLMVAAPATAVTWTALLWEPGQKVLANGFASFWLAAVAAAASLLIALVSRQTHSGMQALTVGGLLVCVCHTWTPLVIIGAPAALLILVRDETSGAKPAMRDRRWWLSIGALAVSGLAALKALSVLLATVPVGFVVSEVSGFDGTSPLPTFLALAVLVFLLARPRTYSGIGSDGFVVRLRLLVLAPLAGMASLTVLLILQVRTIGTTSYYFLKYLLGFELILACVTPAVVGIVLCKLVPIVESRTRRLSIAATATALGTQLFAPGWQASAMLFSTTDDGTAAISTPYTRAGIAQGVLAAVASSSAEHSFDTEYVPLGKGNAVQPFYPDAWFHAVQASVSQDVWNRFAVLRSRADNVEGALPQVKKILSDEQAEVLVDPAVARALKSALRGTDYADRIQALNEAGQ